MPNVFEGEGPAVRIITCGPSHLEVLLLYLGLLACLVHVLYDTLGAEFALLPESSYPAPRSPAIKISPKIQKYVPRHIHTYQADSTKINIIAHSCRVRVVTCFHCHMNSRRARVRATPRYVLLLLLLMMMSVRLRMSRVAVDLTMSPYFCVFIRNNHDRSWFVSYVQTPTLRAGYHTSFDWVLRYRTAQQQHVLPAVSCILSFHCCWY